MKPTKPILFAAALSFAFTALAQQEVFEIKYTDGLTDYIPVSDVSKITFIDGIDNDIPGFVETVSLFDGLKAFNAVYYQHFDFGYPAIMIGLDAHAEDCFTDNTGYNWFSYWYHRYKSPKATPGLMMWHHMYYTIARCADILNAAGTSTPQDKLLRAQAYAMRSFAYWNLIQTFAPNFAFTPGATGVPIVGDKSLPNLISEEFTLSNVSEVYDYILSDINAAINLLSQAQIDPAIIDIEQGKRYVSLDVAYGLRARYNLTMHRYAEAADDAQKAIDNSSATPSLPEATAYPGFCNAKAGNWMWGVTVKDSDRVTLSQIVCFQSQMSPFYSLISYASSGCLRYGSNRLHDYLAAQPADVRNFWFTDQTASNALLSKSQLDIFRECVSHQYDQYINTFTVKFSVRKDGDALVADIPLMRIEEMYYILAEGLAMSGQSALAKSILVDFVSKYRNSDYDCNAISDTDIQNEILMQRRAEFWGEGLVYFDYLRLQRDIDLRNESIYLNWRYFIPGDSHWMYYDYPDCNLVRIGNFNYDDQPEGYPEL